MLVVAPAGPADSSHPSCEAFALGNMQCLQALSNHYSRHDHADKAVGNTNTCMSSAKGSTTAFLRVLACGHSMAAQVRISKKTPFMFMIIFFRHTMITLIWHRWKVMQAGNGMTKLKLLW
jgi:uncharacterized protein YyaL (SSP411 family)